MLLPSTTLALVCGFGFALSLVATPLARALAVRWGLVDRPDSQRKTHARCVPAAGGPAILVSVASAVALAPWLSDPLREEFVGQAPGLVGLLLAAVLICALGVADDFGYLRGRHKLLGQVVVAAVVMTFGVRVSHISVFGWTVELGLLSAPFTLFLLLGAINSLNLIDGMDGLLSSVGVIVSATMAAMALLGGHWATACVALALAGATLGFLRYNFPPATIFLGDSGSMLIGLVIGVLAIESSLKAPATVALAAPTALLTLPIFDTAAAIVRRKLTGRSIYATDRGHLHHCLLRRGLSNRAALLCVCALSLVTGAGALASLTLKNELLAVLSAAAVVAILITTRVFGHNEFSLLRQRLQSTAASLLRVGAPPRPKTLEIRLQGSLDWGELWLTLVACCPQLELKSVRLTISAPALHEGYHARWDGPHTEPEEAALWRAEFPLMSQEQPLGRLEIVGFHNHEPVGQTVARVAKVVEEFETAASQLAVAARARAAREAEAAALAANPD